MSLQFLFLLFIQLLISFSAASQSNQTIQNYIPAFENANHPQIAYWFFTKDQFDETRYKNKIDSISAFSKYTYVFLTPRNGVNSYDSKTMHPVYDNVVKYAHAKGIRIGLQLGGPVDAVPLKNTSRLIQEGEIKLDNNGKGSFTSVAKHARFMNLLLKSELYSVYAFKKSADGFYIPGSLTDITSKVQKTEATNSVAVSVDLGEAMKGYTVYILTQHYYNYWSNYSPQAVGNLTSILKTYSDIPFDGVGLDEYCNLPIVPSWLLKAGDVFRERPYSLPMDSVFKANTGLNLKQTFFDMRYAPTGKLGIRAKAINNYMSVMRSGTIEMEKEIYRAGKLYFGKNTFIGFHDTHHNTLDGDEIWHTGLNWWNIKRDYGQTDEDTPTPTQMGIGFSYPMNAIYNMYYNKNLDKIWTKALTDLRYGIRTHYHAINDVQSWGVSIEHPLAQAQINKVENCARLLNNFNPSFPKIKLLVLFGMESLTNWYPDTLSRNAYDLKGKLKIEEKAMQLWNAGYLNALVPTDEITDGRLSIGANGKPVLQGHEFDAIVFLYPQYARKSTTKFIQEYIKKGGKLIVEGDCTSDFNGNDITEEWKKILSKSVATSFSLDAIAKLGIKKNELQNGVLTEDNTYVFTDVKSIQDNALASFTFTDNGTVFSGNYKGLAAIKIDSKNNVEKLAATGFSSLQKNGNTIFAMNKPADVFIEVKNNQVYIKIAGNENETQIITNKILDKQK
ncbi:hypothetical protein [Flavobacterium gilvum]|uniref:Beta-galactosidase trimerisation domain-containing protein n=1 Tax=Flavobacterium gilvum TaxID=1492737 RepID=A0AAC9I649_9FLAO|nr:hypothetical protein [Flavobacterium gilvum]AOW10775.1 hypothetical protein EM308_15470 [Flavobacterium gilvum]KFC58448.1 hypothetical protein FEM08_27720 [Flavobacterium gilvum]